MLQQLNMLQGGADTLKTWARLRLMQAFLYHLCPKPTIKVKQEPAAELKVNDLHTAFAVAEYITVGVVKLTVSVKV